MEIYNDTYCVYIHTNKINGKKYVGQTINGNNPKKRWDNGNGYRKNLYFYRAIQKYGWDNFEHEVIASNLTAQEADNFEILLIDKLALMNPNRGYNLTSGGTKNKRLSEEVKKKISQSHIGEKNPMYGIRLCGDKNGMFGKHLSEETKEILRQKFSGLNNPNYGKQMSDETKRKISEAKKGKYTGKNNHMYGKHHTDETKKKISESHSGARSHNAKKVVQFSDNYEVIKVWNCIADAWKTLGICRQSIPEVLNGNQKRAGGFRWLYLYDKVKNNGIIIQGAISLGYITEEEI